MFLGANTALKEKAKYGTQTDTLFLAMYGISHIAVTNNKKGCNV